VQECPQPPPGPTSHAGGAGTGAPTDRSRSLAIGRAVRGSRPDQCVDHCPCLPVVLQLAPLSPAQAARTTRGRPQLRPQDWIRSQTRDRRPFVGARHPLRPHFARSSRCRSSMAGSPGNQLADPDHQQWSPHNAQICAAGAERGIDAATAPLGGNARALRGFTAFGDRPGERPLPTSRPGGGARPFVTGAVGAGSAAVPGRAAGVWRYQWSSPEMRLTEPATITTPNR
jgi:hypothetical protein